MKLQNIVLLFVIISTSISWSNDDVRSETNSENQLEQIQLSPDGSTFIKEHSKTTFNPWGFNYDHDASGRLIEDYWHDEWETVVEDFQEMKALGANVVRIHLQTAKFMDSPDSINEDSITQLSKLLTMAEVVGLYLNITGLGCYHKDDVPAWYDEMAETERWQVQARFWQAIAKTCANSPAVFCYDLMNEPILSGGENETDWLAGELGGKHFVQRITLDLTGRTRTEVAKAWVETLVSAIKKHDDQHLITVGVIPWAHTFPGAKPLFHSKEAGESLDFVSVHFYPKAGEVDKALEALAVYDVGKPLVVEEFFPLYCSLEEMDQFINESKEMVDGWISFYWGKTPEQYAEEEDITSAIIKNWLEYFESKGDKILNPQQ